MPCPCFHSSSILSTRSTRSIRSIRSIRKTQNTLTFPRHLTVSVLIHSVVLNLLPLGDVGTRHAESAYALLSDTACRVPTMLLLLLTRRFPFSVFTFPFISYPLRFALPSVALGSAPLRRHRMTFGHSSKDPLRPLSQRDKVECGLLL